MTKYIIREVPPEEMDTSFCFDDDGLTAAGGDFNNTLFIVGNRRISGFNEAELDKVADEIENLYDNYSDTTNKSNYAVYSSVGAMLLGYGLIENIHQTAKIKAYKDFVNGASDSYKPEVLAAYLTLKTGKEWTTGSASGYSQGDYVEMIYCKDSYKNGVKRYGEIWLGACKEFCVINVEDNGEEAECYGFYVADCEVNSTEDYKRVICKQEGFNAEDAQLQMIESEKTVRQYTYKII